MTGPLSDDELDREIRGFLAWQARDVGAAPTPTAMVQRIHQPVRGSIRPRRLAPARTWLLLGALLALALVGAGVGGAMLRADDMPSGYEAVFLRRVDTGDTSAVAVVGVSPATGSERRIATIAGADTRTSWVPSRPAGSSRSRSTSPPRQNQLGHGVADHRPAPARCDPVRGAGHRAGPGEAAGDPVLPPRHAPERPLGAGRARGDPVVRARAGGLSELRHSTGSSPSSTVRPAT